MEFNDSMLDALCGNKNVKRILIFLFVNNKGYGTQLHRCLGVPLTPLQKALTRLEKGGVIASHYEGKTKLYQFNQTYPLIEELQQLLKKAYTLLPAQEKKNYYLIKETPEHFSLSPLESIQVLLSFWDKLQKVSHLTFKAKTNSKEENGWNGQGKGEVVITKEAPNILIFQEKGVWNGKPGTELNFSNSFRWTLDRTAGVISLEHLRRGITFPVFLFYLAPSGKNSLASVDSHLCEGDTYFGQIFFDHYGLRLSWRVIGPKKNEEIDYHYS